jgi:hypothetical protein
VRSPRAIRDDQRCPRLGPVTGTEFQVPRNVSMRLSFEAFQAIHPALFGQILVMRLFTDRSILTQVCGNNFVVESATWWCSVLRRDG